VPPRRPHDAYNATGGENVLAMQASAGSPFLAQYLAQQFFAAAPPPRWRERDGAYRRPGRQQIVPRLSLDI
jgi:hypothetical protein